MTRRRTGLLLIQIAAFWPVWAWYVARLRDGSEEPWGLVPLLLAVVLFARRPPSQEVHGSISASSLATLTYAAAFPFAPPLLRAGLALAAVAATVAPLRQGGRSAALLGLLFLSLPVLASAQFYLGYPLRVISGAVAGSLLSLSGFSVATDGACFRFGSQLVAVDAPCSGVRMLWGGVLLALGLAAGLRLRFLPTVSLVLGAATAVVVANGVRAAALFFPETGILDLPSWNHAAIGVVTFAGAAALVLRGAILLAPAEGLR